MCKEFQKKKGDVSSRLLIHTCRCLNNRQAFKTDIHFIFYPEVQKSNSYCVNCFSTCTSVAVRSEDDVQAL